jgi:putative sigma-54 modulation protein
MKMSITARKVIVRQAFTERTHQKLSKLDKFFDGDADCTVTITRLPRDVLQVEAMVRAGGMIFRAETTDEDANSAIDTLIDLLVRQIRKNKTRLEKRMRSSFRSPEPMPGDTVTIPEEEAFLIRTKRFCLKPMTAEEAILQMNLLGHSFFVYTDADTTEICVVYKRTDDSYGVIIPEKEV